MNTINYYLLPVQEIQNKFEDSKETAKKKYKK